MQRTRMLWSGDEAVARAARDGHVRLGAGYPGTPSTEILEAFSELGGQAQWSPNEKVALEVAIPAGVGHRLEDPNWAGRRSGPPMRRWRSKWPSARRSPAPAPSAP